jgi:hypothetical protein
MSTRTYLAALALLLLTWAAPAPAQESPLTDNPFPDPIEATRDVITVGFEEFATLPPCASCTPYLNWDDRPEGAAARPMNLVSEPGTGRIFVNDQWGFIYRLSADGREMSRYLDMGDPRWGIDVRAEGRERGFQSFAFHPDFGRAGAPGYGRFYTYTDVVDTEPAADFAAREGNVSHHTVLHEWTAPDPSSPTYSGGPPRTLIRMAQPFANHNAGHSAFNPYAQPGDADYGLLYIGVGDGGSGGDPQNLSQDLSSVFGKLLRIDPLGSNARNGRYGIPADNPFVGRAGALDEIFAYGLRNPQRLAWDANTDRIFVADIGQGTIEKVSEVSAGANLGWNVWEGSFRFVSGQAVSLENPRSDPEVTYPFAEFDQIDPLFTLPQVAATGLAVYRSARIPQLRDLLLFGDLVSGEIFYVHADRLPQGGQEFRRVLLRDADGRARTFLEVIQEKKAQLGGAAPARTDLKIIEGPEGSLFLTNKHDGTIRRLVP